MRLIRLILGRSRGMLALIALTSIASGAFNAGLIAVMNAALYESGRAGALAWIFVALVAARLLANAASQTLVTVFSQRLVAELRCDLVKTILAVPLRQVEEVGAARLMVTLSEDVGHVTDGLRGVPNVAYNAALLAGGGAYLMWLSWRITIGMTAVMLLGALAYRVVMRSGMGSLRRARADQDDMFEHFRALTDGIKELKLHRERRAAFQEDGVREAALRHARNNVVASLYFLAAQTWCNLLFFFVIGAMLFFFGRNAQIEAQVVSGYLITALFLMGPLTALMGSFTFMGRAAISLGKVEELAALMASQASENRPTDVPPASTFRRLQLRGVTHGYHSERDERHFQLGPIDLDLVPGEIVFVVGGNGSGKSTLGKILCGLYPPERGHILLDGRPVDDATRDDYRQLFSAVFSDFFVFESLLGMQAVDRDPRARHYLAQLHLDRKVTIEDGMLSTTSLSQGQRKRLALLTAWMEDRPLYLFDEWAADQDPQFKALFYTELLPDLAARGKTVVAITHDDRWFHVADRIVKLDEGRLVSDRRIEHVHIEEEAV